MTIRFSCSCGQQITARNEYAGKRVQCNNCKKVQIVPGQRGGVPTKLSTSRPAVATPPPAAEPSLPPTLVSSPPPLAAPVAPAVLHTESPLLAQPVTGSTVLRVAAPVTVTGQDPRTAGVRFRCLCGAEYQARQEHAGQPTRCPCCGEVLFIPPRVSATAGPVPAARERPDRYQPRREGLSTGMRLGLVALVLLVLAAAGYGAWEFYFKEKAADVKRERERRANVLDFVPADAVAFVSVRVADYADLLLGDKLLEKLPPEARALLVNALQQREALKKQLAAFEMRLGFRITDVELAVLVVPNAEGTTAWAAVQLKKSARIDAGKLKQLFETPKEKTFAGRSYFVPAKERGTALHVADDHLFVMASSAGIEAFLSDRRAREGPLSPALRYAAQDKHPLVLAVRPPPQAAKVVEDAAAKWPAWARRYGPLLRVKTVTLSTETKGGGEALLLEADYGDPNKAKQALRLLTALPDDVKRELAPLLKDVPPQALAPVLELLGRIRGRAEQNTLHVSLTSDVPGLTGVAAGAIALGMLLPAVQKVREAAGRVQAQNNLKQLTLAMINYAGDHGGQLPPAFTSGSQGQPLLSWRVALLPYVEEGNLYRQFHLNEPWNSPHNRQLLSRMPRVYQSPASPLLPASGMTFTQVFTGPSTPFPGGRQALRYPASFRDGTSNTILVAEGANAVQWTAPQDMAYGPRVNPLMQIGRHNSGQALVGMADGSVRLLSRTLSEKTLRAAITPSGGDMLGPDWNR